MRCEEANIKSIAFPLIGTGVGDFPLNEAVKIMIDVVKDHIYGDTNLKEIIFALFTKKAYVEFENLLANLNDKYENQ